jgi:hypothetical protein
MDTDGHRSRPSVFIAGEALEEGIAVASQKKPSDAVVIISYTRSPLSRCTRLTVRQSP